MRELELIKDKAEVILCATMALIQAHKKAKLVDREAVQSLETKLRQDRTNCGEMALCFAGMFLWHTGRYDKAREYVDRMIKMSQNGKEVSRIYSGTYVEGTLAQKRGSFWKDSLGKGSRFCSGGGGEGGY